MQFLFIFIAPERLRIRGFPETLAKRKPSLLAIDEAHCISQWGHDFRPDHRILDQYLAMLRPASAVALTATATPLVQKDIIKQLGLAEPARFIDGFRRDNIAIEVVELPPSQRIEVARDMLLDPSRRPAIVYTPIRKQAETMAFALSADCAAAPYHAGLDAEPCASSAAFPRRKGRGDGRDNRMRAHGSACGQAFPMRQTSIARQLNPHLCLGYPISSPGQ